MKKLYVTFSEEARLYTDEHGYSKLSKQKKLNEGYDWQLKEFASQEIMDAYIQGLKDANGWDEPNWCECTVENGLMPKYGIFHNVDGEKITRFKNDAELVNFVRKVAIENGDDDIAITCIDEAISYLNNYCEDLTLVYYYG